MQESTRPCACAKPVLLAGRRILRTRSPFCIWLRRVLPYRSPQCLSVHRIAFVDTLHISNILLACSLVKCVYFVVRLACTSSRKTTNEISTSAEKKRERESQSVFDDFPCHTVQISSDPSRRYNCLRCLLSVSLQISHRTSRPQA